MEASRQTRVSRPYKISESSKVCDGPPGYLGGVVFTHDQPAMVRILYKGSGGREGTGPPQPELSVFSVTPQSVTVSLSLLDSRVLCLGCRSGEQMSAGGIPSPPREGAISNLPERLCLVYPCMLKGLVGTPRTSRGGVVNVQGHTANCMVLALWSP